MAGHEKPSGCGVVGAIIAVVSDFCVSNQWQKSAQGSVLHLQRSSPGDKLELTNCHARVVMWNCLNMQPPPVLAAPQCWAHRGLFPSSAEMVRMWLRAVPFSAGVIDFAVSENCIL